MANKLVKLQFIFLAVIVIATLIFSFITMWLFVECLLPLTGTNDGKLQDFLGIYSFSNKQIEGEVQLLINLALVIVLCLCEMIPWLAVGYIIFQYLVLGMAFVSSRYLIYDEFIQVFGLPDKWRRLFLVSKLMKKISAKCDKEKKAN